MGQFDRAIATAARLIAKNGQVVTWRKMEDGTPPDATKPWKPAAATNTDFQVPIVFLPDNRKGYEWLAALKGTEVPKGSLTGIMAAPTGFTPTIKDVVIRGGQTLAIETLDELSPNGQIIMYEIRFCS